MTDEERAAADAAAKAAAEKTAAEKAAAEAAAKAGAAAVLMVSADEYRKLIDAERKLADINAENERKLEAERQKAIDAQAKKGEVEEALRKEREVSSARITAAEAKAAQVEAERLGDKKGEVIASALLGIEFINEFAPGQVKALLTDRFEAVRDASGQIAVREKGTLKPAADVVKAWLGTEGAGFVKATNKGGAGGGGDKPAPTITDDGKPLPFDQQIVAAIKSRAASEGTPKYPLVPRAKSGA